MLGKYEIYFMWMDYSQSKFHISTHSCIILYLILQIVHLTFLSQTSQNRPLCYFTLSNTRRLILLVN